MTHYPFNPKFRVSGEEVSIELWENIKKIADFYKLDTSKMSANITLRPNPEDNGQTHYATAEVIYEDL